LGIYGLARAGVNFLVESAIVGVSYSNLACLFTMKLLCGYDEDWG